MKKVLLALAFTATAVIAEAQVGIGTDQPKATLDIVGANTSTSIDGIIIPRVSRAKAITMVGDSSNTVVENSTLIYVNDVTGYVSTDTSVASEVDVTGFYYYKKSTSKWTKMPDYDQVTDIVTDNTYWKAQAPSTTSPKNESLSKATDLDDLVAVDIYQKGKVGIGYSDAFGIDFGKTNTQKQLEVGGDFRTSHFYEDKVDPKKNTYFGFETNSVALPDFYAVRGNVMYSAKSNNLEDYSKSDKLYDGNILVQTDDTFMVLSRTGIDSDLTGKYATETEITSKSVSFLIDHDMSKHGSFGSSKYFVFNNDEFGIRDQIVDDKAFGINFKKNNNSFYIGSEYYKTSYYFPDTKGTIGQTLTLADADGNLEWTNSLTANAAPQFFYMPSIVLPTTPTGTAGTQVTEANGVYTVDLYAVFKAQFDTPIKSSNGTATGLQGFVLDRNKYEYHIIYADGNVFPHADIIFLADAGNEGKLTYKVNPNVIVRNGSFMNIVLKVK